MKTTPADLPTNTTGRSCHRDRAVRSHEPRSAKCAEPATCPRQGRRCRRPESLVVGVCAIGVLNCGFSPSVCSATVTSLFRRGVARWTPGHESTEGRQCCCDFLEFRALARAPNYNPGDLVHGGQNGRALATALLIAVCS